MSYKKIPLRSVIKNNEQLRNILALPFIKESLEVGGTIAGGFVRNVLLKNDIYDYLSISDYTKNPVVISPGGDVDIFFENIDQVKQAYSLKDYYSYIDDLIVEPSMTSICANIKYDTCKLLKEKINGKIKIQLVSGFYGNAEEIMETFDFTNSRCAIDAKYVYFDESFFYLEKNNLLDIKLGTGPLTGHRILKYINKKGLATITQESRDAISEWSIRYGKKIWDNHPMAKVGGIDTTRTITSLMRDERIFTNEDLLNLVGLIKTRKIKNITGPNIYSRDSWIESDLAIDIISQRA